MGKRYGTRRVLGLSAFLFLLAVSRGLSATDNDPDTIAKYLSGLTVPAVPAGAPSQILAPTPKPVEIRPAFPAVTPSPAPTFVPAPGSLIPRRRHSPGPTSRASAIPQPSVSTLNSSTSQPGDNPWLTHSAELDQAWKRTQEQQLSGIANWAPEFLGGAYQANTTMFYMFSGPDFLYAHAFFPNARTYIFCGNEPVGTPPDISRIPPSALPVALANIRKSLESVLNWSFFITKDMKTDLTRTELSGTLPLLYVFLARLHCTIESVTPVAIDRDGNVSEGEKGETAGVRIVFTSSPGSSQTLYYFCSDLSDDGVKATPGFLRFCEQQGQGVSLLKAASYLMHEPGFSRVREFLLEHSSLILQDDSGIPLRFLAEKQWNIRYYGRYTGPIDVFKKYWQPDLADNYARQVSPSLPFGFGYQWQPDHSDVMIATPPEIGGQKLPAAPTEILK